MPQDINIRGLPEAIAFPDDWSQEQIFETVDSDKFKRAIYGRYGKIIQSDDDADDWEITKSLKSGAATIGSGFSGALAVLGVNLNNPELVEWSKEQLADYQMKRLVHQGKNPTLQSIGSEGVVDFLSSPEQWDGFLNWAIHSFGNAAATTAPTILGAALAPFSGGASLAFIAGYGAMMGAGEAFDSAMREGLSDETAANIALGVMGPHAALELAPGSVFMKQFKNFVTAGKDFAKHTAKDVVTKGVPKGAGAALKKAPTLVKDMAKGFRRGSVAEGFTEAGQEMLIEGTVQRVAGNHAVFRDPEFWKQVGEAGAAGALGGGALASITAGLTYRRPRPEPEEPPLLEQPPEEPPLLEPPKEPPSPTTPPLLEQPPKPLLLEPPVATLRHPGELSLAELNEEITQLQDSVDPADLTRRIDLENTRTAQLEEINRQLEVSKDLQDMPDPTAPLPILAEEEATTVTEEDVQAAHQLGETIASAPVLPTSEQTTGVVAAPLADMGVQPEAVSEAVTDISKGETPGVPGTPPATPVSPAKTATETQTPGEGAPGGAVPGIATTATLGGLPSSANAEPTPALPVDPEVLVTAPPEKLAKPGWIPEAVKNAYDNRNKAYTALTEKLTKVRRDTPGKELIWDEPRKVAAETKAADDTAAALATAINGIPDLSATGRARLLNNLAKIANLEETLKDKTASKKAKNAASQRIKELREYGVDETDVDAELNIRKTTEDVVAGIIPGGSEQMAAYIRYWYPDTAPDNFRFLDELYSWYLHNKGLLTPGAIQAIKETVKTRTILPEVFIPSAVTAILPAKVKTFADLAKAVDEAYKAGTLPKPEYFDFIEKSALAPPLEEDLSYLHGTHSRIPRQAERAAKLEGAFEEVRRWLDKIGLRDVSLSMPWELLDPNQNTDPDIRLAGNWTRGLIEIAMDNPNRLGTAKHEVIHALKEMGLFTKQEWATLKRMAKQWRKIYDVDELYRADNLTEEKLDEEAIAMAFENWNIAPSLLPPTSRFHAFFQRIKDFLNAILEALGRQGFNTAEDIFGRIESGAVGMRPRMTDDMLDLPGEKWSVSQPGLRARSKNLKRWFGESVVKTLSGHPLIQYHGTFDPEAWGPLGSLLRFNRGESLGVHFGTAEQANAIEGGIVLENAARRDVRRGLIEAHGEELVSLSLDSPVSGPETVAIKERHDKQVLAYIKAREGHSILPVYLRIQNPLRIPDMQNWNPSQIVKLLTQTFHQQEMGFLRRDLVNNLTRNNLNLNAIEIEALADAAMADVDPIFSPDEGARILRNITAAQTIAERNNIIRAELKAKGYDGFVYKNTVELDVHSKVQQFNNSYTVFDPDQVKAVNNYGTYQDTENAMHSRNRVTEESDSNAPPNQSYIQHLFGVFRNLWSAIQRQDKIDRESPLPVTGTSSFGNFSKWIASCRHLAQVSEAFGKFQAIMDLLHQHSSTIIEDAGELLKPFGQLKKEPEVLKKVSLAIEIAMLQGGRYRPSNYDAMKAAADARGDVLGREYWDSPDTTIEIVNAPIKVGDRLVPAKGKGKGSTLVGGETVTLSGKEAEAYVGIQEAFLMASKNIRDSFVWQNAEDIDTALDLLKVGVFEMVMNRQLEENQTALSMEKLTLNNLQKMTDEELLNIESQLQTMFDMIAPTLNINPAVYAWSNLKSLYLTDPNKEGLNDDAFDYGWFIPTAATKDQAYQKYAFSSKAKELLEGLNEVTELPAERIPKRENPVAKAEREAKRRFRQNYINLIAQAKEETRNARARAREGGIQATGEATSGDKVKFEELMAALSNIKELNSNLAMRRAFHKKDFISQTRIGKHYIAVWAKKDISKVPGQKGPLPGVKPAHFELLNLNSLTLPTKKMKDNVIRTRLRELMAKYGEENFVFADGVADQDQVRKSISDRHIDVDMIFGQLSNVERKAGEATHKALNRVLSRRGLRAIFKERADIPGYELDWIQSTGLYIAGMAKLSAEMRYVQQARKVIDDEMHGELKTHALHTMEYVLSPHQEWRKIRMAGFVWYLGANFSSAILQTASIPLIVLPYLTMYTGFKGAPRAAVALSRAAKDIVKMADFSSARNWADVFLNLEKSGLAADEIAAIKEGIQRGILKPYSLLDEIGISIYPNILDKALTGRGFSISNIGKVGIAGMFSTMETASRMTAFLASYRLMKNKKYREKGVMVLKDNPLLKAKLEQEGFIDPTPTDMALFMVQDTFGVFGKENRPRYMQEIGSVLFQFAMYPHVIWELLGRMLIGTYGKEGRKAFAAAILMIALTSGVRGVPGVDDLEELIRYLRRKFGSGLDHDLSLLLRETVQEAGFGQHVADVIEKGVINAYFGIDVQRRLAIQLPGSSMLKVLIGMRGDVYDAMGVPGALIFGNVRDSVELFNRGRWGEAGMRMMPQAARNVAEAAHMGAYGIRSKSGNQLLTPKEVSVTDQIKKAFGFQPGRAAKARELEFTEQNLIRANREYQRRVTKRLTDLNYDLVQATLEGNVGEVADTRAQMNEIVREILEHNQDAKPEHLINPSIRTIRKGVRRRLQPGRAKDYPKRLRRRMHAVQEFFKKDLDR